MRDDAACGIHISVISVLHVTVKNEPYNLLDEVAAKIWIQLPIAKNLNSGGWYITLGLHPS